MSLRELIIEYILFAWSEVELMDRFNISAPELQDLSDVDLLEIYDTTLLAPVDPLSLER
jgi:hypothetical protein